MSDNDYADLRALAERRSNIYNPARILALLADLDAARESLRQSKDSTASLAKEAADILGCSVEDITGSDS